MKTIISLFALSLLLFSCSGTQSLHKLMQDYTKEYYRLNPDTALEKGIDERLGITVPDRFTDTSPSGVEKEVALIRAYQKKLSKIDIKTLQSRDRIYYDIFKSYLDTRTEESAYLHHWYVINPMFSSHSTMVSLITEALPITSVKDAERYLKRMKQMPARLAQDKKRLALQVTQKILPSKIITDQYIQAMQSFSKTPAKENPLYTSLSMKLQNAKIDEVQAAKILGESEKIITDIIYPAYTSYIEYVVSIREQCDDNDGVWKLPNGDAYYSYALQYHTSSSKTPVEIHTIGVHEVEKLQKEITALIVSLGISKKSTFNETLRAYWDYCSKNPALGYPQTEAGKEQTIEDYRAIIAATESKLPALFSVLPKNKVTVERVPLYKERTAGTYYQPAPLDGSVKGIFYANMGYDHFKPDMPALTYHESIPGHHLQIALQQEIGLPLFFSIPFFTAFIEGWAMYAEHLAYEEGWYTDVHTRISYLQSALFRAARMVVDTGIHYKRWSREESKGYMEKTVGWGGDGQINRYSVWPGQACAYMYGKLALLEIREKVKAQMGTSFDIKEFHKVVLENGSVPLPLLEQIVINHFSRNK